jgi:EAL domain-containing protein (putative c-di-GMP-specific phosphodiesterase class I)
MMTAEDCDAFFQGGRLINHYQPIVNVQTGKLLGFEILARLLRGNTIVPPGVFLPNFDEDSLEALLVASVRQSARFLAACEARHGEFFLSFNVSPRVMLRKDFVANLVALLRELAVPCRRVTLEILENDEFLSLPAAKSVLWALHECGFCIALDDVGTGYSSLNRLQELPMVNKIKLDQTFVRGIESEPSGLHFVSAMLTLARSLRDEMFVEGVETDEILQALTVLGVEGAQGYAIARPLPASEAIAWLARLRPQAASRVPTSLLGAYAAHLTIVETCRALMNQPMPLGWTEQARDPHACAIGQYFDAAGLHETAFGQAHKRFHAVIDQYDTKRQAWEDASEDLWRGLHEAIHRGARSDAPASALATLPRAPACDCPAAAAPSSLACVA